MPGCTAPVYGHRTASGAANCPARGSRSYYRSPSYDTPPTRPSWSGGGGSSGGGPTRPHPPHAHPISGLSSTSLDALVTGSTGPPGGHHAGSPRTTPLSTSPLPPRRAACWTPELIFVMSRSPPDLLTRAPPCATTVHGTTSPATLGKATSRHRSARLRHRIAPARSCR